MEIDMASRSGQRMVLGLFIALISLVDVPPAVASSGAASTARPNLLIVLADDLGYGDLGCMGARHLRTPNIDELAARGVRCMRGYVASSVCSPSRAGLLTGRDPRRFGYEGNLNQSADGYAGRAELLGLPVAEWTIADHLKAANYQTALIGKWHQGGAPQFHPNRRGFDHFVGMLGGGHDYFPSADENELERNGAPLCEFSSPYLTDFFTDAGLAWLEQARGRPWFLFMSYNAPHTPMQATEADLAHFEHIADDKRRTYAAMVYALDRGVGRLVAFLRETDQLDNTLIVFLSDNGGAANNAAWNGPLSGCKGTLREGGVRVPFIVSWPAELAQGVTSGRVVSALDLVPTLLAAARVEPRAEQARPTYEDPRNVRRYARAYGRFDGVNFLPVLQQAATPPPRTLHWRLQGQSAILMGDLKLITLAHRPPQLFAVADDPGETRDLATAQPRDLSELYNGLGEWEARLPTVPIWDSSPFWIGDSARLYDTQVPRTEPH
jgi:arylsulfatase A-like enzyme